MANDYEKSNCEGGGLTELVYAAQYARFLYIYLRAGETRV